MVQLLIHAVFFLFVCLVLYLLGTVFVVQIPLGVLLYDENKLDDMAHILDHYMSLVPAVEKEQEATLADGNKIKFDNTYFFPILFGGDQMTVARIRGVQLLRDTEVKRADRFEGIIPVVEDWHTRMTVMKVGNANIVNE